MWFSLLNIPCVLSKDVYSALVGVSVNADYFAQELCVSNAINFNTEGTYARVAKGAGVFNLTTDEVMYNLDIFQKLYPASTTKILTAYIIIKDCNFIKVPIEMNNRYGTHYLSDSRSMLKTDRYGYRKRSYRRC